MAYIGAKIASGASWMLGMRFVVRGIGLLSTIIVARLLSPEDFGLVALATSVYALVEFLGAFGFGEAIIQRHEPERKHYDTAWTLNVAFGIFAGAGLALAAKPVAGFFDEPRLELIIYVLSAVAVIDRSYNIGVEYFKKELEMEKIFRLQVTQKVISFLVTVTAAIIFKSYWALVLGMAIGTSSYSIMTYWVSRYRPRITIEKFNDLFRYSRWLLFTSILTYLDRKAGPIIIGKLAGASSIGIFSVSQNLANLPAVELVKPLNQALFPGYSKIKNEPETLRRYYLKSLSLVSLMAFPAATGLAITAPSLVPLLLGEQWDKAIPVMQVLAMAGVAQALAIVSMSIHMAINQPHLTTVFNGAKVSLLAPLLIYAVSNWGVIGAAWAYFGVNMFLTPLRIWTVKHSLSVPMKELVGALWRPLLATSAMALILISATPPLKGFPLGVQVLALFMLGALSYGFLILGFWKMAGSPDSGEEFLYHQVRSYLPNALRYG